MEKRKTKSKKMEAVKDFINRNKSKIACVVSAGLGIAGGVAIKVICDRLEDNSVSYHETGVGFSVMSDPGYDPKMPFKLEANLFNKKDKYVHRVNLYFSENVWTELIEMEKELLDKWSNINGPDQI